jgi:hypothetical protein
MKKCYLISFDMADGGDYDTIVEAVKAYGTWAHVTESTWAVVSKDNHKEIRDDLRQYLPEGSRLFVVESGVAAAWQDVICRGDWLRKRL